MKFSNFKIQQDDLSTSVKASTQLKTKINVSKDLLKIKPKPSRDKVRSIEPGVKIGTGQFLSICQECEVCNKVTGHAHKPEKRRMICLECKTIKTY